MVGARPLPGCCVSDCVLPTGVERNCTPAGSGDKGVVGGIVDNEVVGVAEGRSQALTTGAGVLAGETAVSFFMGVACETDAGADSAGIDGGDVGATTGNDKDDVAAGGVIGGGTAGLLAANLGGELSLAMGTVVTERTTGTDGRAPFAGVWRELAEWVILWATAVADAGLDVTMGKGPAVAAAAAASLFGKTG